MTPRSEENPLHRSKRPATATAKRQRKGEGRAHRHKKRRRVSKPLEVTPPLGLRHYVFPVVGFADYIDTYGDFRGDVHGKWHHGDDIFAPLGAPVVAVASGTINRVGWRRTGGWRLWVRDSAADEFYYAHLSGYSRTVFHSRHVKAGQVIGFVGNTGDAFPGAPHLHFEIHPRQLLRLRYDGAVDPTTYLDSWTHLETVHVPRPAHPRLPKRPLFRWEARRVFRELLVAQHLIKEPPAPSQVRVRSDPDRSAAQALTAADGARAADGETEGAALGMPLLAGLTALALFAAMMLLARLPRRLRRRSG